MKLGTIGTIHARAREPRERRGRRLSNSSVMERLGSKVEPEEMP